MNNVNAIGGMSFFVGVSCAGAYLVNHALPRTVAYLNPAIALAAPLTALLASKAPSIGSIDRKISFWAIIFFTNLALGAVLGVPVLAVLTTTAAVLLPPAIYVNWDGIKSAIFTGS
jgi:hypothetical protein